MFLALLAAADFALLAGAGTRGERRVEAVAHAATDDLGLTLGASTSEGERAPQRQQILAGAEHGAFKGELRVVPQSGGLFEVAAEGGVHFESIGLVLDARTASLGRMELRGAGARLELESQLAEDLHGGVSGSIWLLQLDGAPRLHPWVAWGNATLDWSQRWEAGGWLSYDCLDLSLSIAEPAQEGFEVRSGLSFEWPAGPVKLRAAASVARSSGMWLADATLGVTMTLE